MVAEATEVEPRWERAGEPIQFTREELLDRTRRLGVSLTARQFRSWAELGLLPAPERRVPPASDDGIVRALYPGWTAALIWDLDEKLRLGAKLASLRDYAAARMRAYRAQGTLELPEPRPRDAEWPRVPRALQRAAWEYIARFEAGLRVAGAVHEAVLTLRLATGADIAVPVLRPPASATDETGHLPED